MVWVKTQKQKWMSDIEEVEPRQHDADMYDDGGRSEFIKRKQRHHEEGRHSDLGFD